MLAEQEYLGRNTHAYYEILAEVGRGSWLELPVER
jgi:hypothetical protein